MGEKKVVGRTVAITLGITCVVLAAVLVGGIWNYTQLQAYYDNRGTNIQQLQQQLQQLQTYYDNRGTNIQQLQTQVNDLNDKVNLAKSEVWATSQTVSQPAGYYSYWTYSASYAGYVTVQVQSSTTDKTYIELLYSSHGVNYYNKISIGISGTGVFPVLPSNSIEVRVGNTNYMNGATETVTITYTY